MSENIVIERKPVLVGVIGGHTQDEGVLRHAQELGMRIAEKGYVLVTGGGPGVMEAASKGAHDSGGLVIGILPNDREHPLKDYPNAFVDIAIYTGMLDARNVINVKTPHVIVALKGSYGTISEIALALKVKTPVISLSCPEYECFRNEELFLSVDTVNQVMSLIEKLIKDFLN